jgi:penicillin G amidase
MGKWVVRIGMGLGALALLAVLAVGGFAAYVAHRLDASLPQLAGEAILSGADGEIDIVRDRYGVPHIFATTEADAYRGLGYAHAQDRFVQMDLTRRSMQGRLAEVVGERALEMDARARIMNWAGVAQAQYYALTPEVKAILEAYTDGVNAGIAATPTPPEYALLMAKPEPWAPVDAIACALAMTNELTGGEAAERQRAMLATVLEPDLAASFLPGYPDWAARSYGAQDFAGQAGVGAPAPKPASGAMDSVSPGSNAWVVSGARTGTGKPILANDPHLALNAPGPFYLARLQTPDGPLIGASLPGAPIIVIGRNASLAWGATTHAVDAADEIPLTPQMRLTARKETIKINVLGMFTREVQIEARSAAEGPVMEPAWWHAEKSYAKAYGDKAVVRRTIADDPDNGVAEAFYRGSKAKTVDAYFTAIAPWTAPPQNMVVADSQGAIGMISPGRFPQRDANGAWTGFLPSRIMAKNPARGYFATANNQQMPKGSAIALPGGHDPYRVTLIDEALVKDTTHDLASAKRLQTDRVVLLARRIIPALALSKPATPDGQAMLKALTEWDQNAHGDSRAATKFAYFLRSFGELLYKDELGEEIYKEFQGPREVFLDGVLTGGVNPIWCDVKRTQARETCLEIAAAALDAAAGQLIREHGPNEDAWVWGPIHAAKFRNLVWSGLPMVGEDFTVTTAFGGMGTSINVARNRHAQPGFSTVHAAGLRMVIDFSDLNASQFVMAPGQSGHPRSKHYRDLAVLWGRGAYFEIRDDWGPESLPDGAQRLTLRPE